MFDDLTETERDLLTAVAAGEKFGDASDGPYGRDTMRAWGPDRTIRAEVLRHLLVTEDWVAQAGGVQASGLRVSGALDIGDARVRCPLVLWRCLFEEPIDVCGATVSRLFLGECVLDGIEADGLSATIGLSLARSTVARGVRMIGAAVTGALDLTGCTLGPDAEGDALSLDRITAHGGVFLASVHTRGTVRLHSANVRGNVDLSGASLGTAGGASLVADNLVTDGSVALVSVTADGALRLPGAQIGGQLVCRRARVLGADADGSLVAMGTTVRGDVFLDDAFAAAGSVRLQNARIGGSLLINAELDGRVAFVADGARVEQELVWRPMSPIDGVVDLERMSVGRFTDDIADIDAAWPPAGRLRLTGFMYDGFGSSTPLARRLAWIRRQDPYETQPYEQLAKVYRQAGRDADARGAAIAKLNDLRKYGDLSRARRLVSWVLDVTVRHGYALSRAAYLLVGLYVVVVAVFIGAQHQRDAMVPAKNTTPPLPAGSALHCRDGYPCFYPATYALDLVVPILDVQDGDAWRPDGHRPLGVFYVAVGVIATVFGWAFSTLAVLGFTGVVRKE